ncbi:MAG: hypothetical protein ACUVRM_05390 [Bacillota bacterium]
MGWIRKMGRRLLRAALLGLVRPRRRSLLGRAVSAVSMVAPFFLYTEEKRGGTDTGATRPPERR